jgi:hypothetical protein
MSNPITTPEQAIRVMQIIAIALVMGVVLFALIAVFMLGALDEPADGFIVSLIGAAFASGAFVMHLIVPSLMTGSAAGDGAASDELSHYQRYQAKLIVGLALLEGAAFFNIIATIIEHNWWSLAIAGCLVFWMLAMFPTRTRVKHWIESRNFNHG